MKRRLIVLRHAKSAWNTDAPTDHARPLNKRGRRDAPRVAEHLVGLGWVPERVISSDSERTRQTWSRMQAAFGEGVEVTFTRALYHAELQEVREQLAPLPDEVSSVMVIGHNPGWEEMAGDLAGEDLRMTTCNAALLSLEADSWSQALGKLGQWRLHTLIRPKELR